MIPKLPFDLVEGLRPHALADTPVVDHLASVGVSAGRLELVRHALRMLARAPTRTTVESVGVPMCATVIDHCQQGCKAITACVRVLSSLWEVTPEQANAPAIKQAIASFVEESRNAYAHYTTALELQLEAVSYVSGRDMVEHAVESRRETPAEFAAAMDLCPEALAEVLDGRRPVPKAMAQRLSERLHVRPSVFLRPERLAPCVGSTN